MLAIQVYSGDDERVAITALCLDTATLARVAATLPEEPFGSRYGNLVAGWCCTYYHEYKEAPGPAGLTAMYADWATTADKATAETVAKLLQSLPPGLEMSSDYAVDLIQKLVLRIAAKRLADKIQGALSNGKVEEALQLVEGFKRPEVAKDTDGIYPLEDMEALDRAYDQTQGEPLIKIGGALGQFLGPTLCRDAFVSLLAPEKSGKSYHLLGLGVRAVAQGRRVAMFNLGDLSEAQVERRLATAVVGRPVLPGDFKIPTLIKYEGKEPQVTHEAKFSPSGYTRQDAKDAFIRLAGGDPKRFKLVTKGAGTYSVRALRDTLTRWADDGWTPDVVICDYAELFSWPNGCKDQIQAIDANWTQLRAISTEFHCLLLTATQSNKDSYGSWLLGMGNFSGAKTKNAHVTALIGLNVTEYERRLGLTRLNYVVLREQAHLDKCPNSVVAVAGCPAIGRPHLISSWI